VVQELTADINDLNELQCPSFNIHKLIKNKSSFHISNPFVSTLDSTNMLIWNYWYYSHLG